MSNKRLSLLLIVLLYSAFCFGQESDYLVTTKGDSLIGKVKITSFETDQAQITVDKKKKLFQSWQISKVHSKGVTYYTQKRANQYRFMTKIKKGYLSLYGYKEANSNYYDGRYLVKKDGSSMDLPNLGFKKYTSDFLSDCAQVANDVKNGPLGRNDIERIVDQYNLCISAITKQRYTETPHALVGAAQVTITSEYSPKLDAVVALEKKLDVQPDFENKKNAMDLIHDMESKIKSNTAVPPYLLEALKGYIGTKPELTEELTAVSTALQN